MEETKEQVPIMNRWEIQAQIVAGLPKNWEDLVALLPAVAQAFVEARHRVHGGVFFSPDPASGEYWMALKALTLLAEQHYALHFERGMSGKRLMTFPIRSAAWWRRLASAAAPMPSLTASICPLGWSRTATTRL